MTVLGIDAGASSTKWVVLDGSGRALERDRSNPMTGHLFDPGASRDALEALSNVVSRVRTYAPRAVVAGITGLSGGTDVAHALRDEMAQKLNLSPDRVTIMSDMDLAYRAHFRPGEGILIYAGTGAIAYHIRADHRVVRAGGRGFLIDDRGGGFSIGQAALRTVTRWMDTEEPANLMQRPLAATIFTAIGSVDWNVMREHVYGGGRRAVAALAPKVGLAAQKGDLAAHGILVQAGQDLAELALILRARVGDLPVVLCGGALEVSGLIEQSVREHLPLSVKLAISKTSSAEAAARMALQLASRA
jgi:N-acetylglucosamine kinase-like BadF-type ATPase